MSRLLSLKEKLFALFVIRVRADSNSKTDVGNHCDEKRVHTSYNAGHNPRADFTDEIGTKQSIRTFPVRPERPCGNTEFACLHTGFPRPHTFADWILVHEG